MAKMEGKGRHSDQQGQDLQNGPIKGTADPFQKGLWVSRVCVNCSQKRLVEGAQLK